MTIDLSEQVIIYTGAGGLIGSKACQRLAENGASLCLVDPDKERTEALEKTILKNVPNARVLTVSNLDGLDTETVDCFLKKVERELGHVTCLINSAYPRTADWHLKFEEIPLESWQKNMDDHLNGYFLLTQRVARRMMILKQGNIINFGSIYGLVGPDFSIYDGLGNMTMPAAYAAIKGGIINLTRYLAAYLGPYGIRVNAICPGGVKDNQDIRFVKAYENKVPLKRMATIEDVTGPLLFLVSNLSSYVSGVALAVDGGWTAV